MRQTIGSFDRKRALISYAMDVGQRNNKLVPGGSLHMTPERIIEAAAYIDPVNSCEALTKEEIDWMDAILYRYGLPWGG